MTRNSPLRRQTGAPRRLLLPWVMALLLPLAFVAPAVAAPPTTEVVVIVNFDYVDTEICGAGLPITFAENGTFKIKTYYDGAGNVVKTILTNFNDRYTDSASANGKTLTSNYPLAVITWDQQGTFAGLGLRAAYHVPGAGIILLDAGRVVFDLETGAVISSAGPHQVLDGSAPAFCAYFAA